MISYGDFTFEVHKVHPFDPHVCSNQDNCAESGLIMRYGFLPKYSTFSRKKNGNILIENLFQEKVFLKCPFGFIFNHYFTKTSSITGWKNDLPVFNIPCRLLNNCLLRSLSHIKNKFWSLCWKGNIYVLTTITGRIYPP